MTDAQALVERNIRIARAVAHQFRGRVPPQYQDDLYGEALVGLWNAAKTYKPDRGKFSAYAFRVVANELRMFIRKVRRWTHQGNMAYLDEPVAGEDDDLTLLETLGVDPPDYAALIDLDDALSRMPELRMIAEGKNYPEIARVLGVKHSSSVANRVRRRRIWLRERLAVREPC